MVYDIDSQGNIYLNYEADSTIYKYSPDFRPIKAFGYQGKEMNTDYKPINTFTDCRTYLQKERQTKGYYNSIFIDNEKSLIFRSYQKGIPAETDGLQIYRDDLLIGDLSVPKALKVGGYIAPYYYSAILTDIENEKIYVYRFKIP